MILVTKIAVCMYACMYCHQLKQRMDQPGKVANFARCQLSEFGLARRFCPSRPASVCSFFTFKANRSGCVQYHVKRHRAVFPPKIRRIREELHLFT